jgi:anti-sigma regulatory factor (Ser/Thr protein kinase)
MRSSVLGIYRIELGSDGPAQARQILTRELAACVPPAALDDIKLMVSELVTNGIVHGGAADEPITLEVRADTVVRCEVIDHGPGVSLPSDHDTGWGLRLVERLAGRWGFTRAPDRTHVWFETALGPK